jgi:hypothetical protein
MKGSSIKIIAATEKEPITFSGFADFVQSSKYIQKLWRAGCGQDSDDQSEDEKLKTQPTEEVK